MSPTTSQLLLSVYPSARGFAYILFEGPLTPLDWGLRRLPGASRNRLILDAVERLIARYHPDTLVCEKLSIAGSRRAARVADLYLAFSHLACARNVEMARYDRKAIRQCFASAGAKTKPEIAFAIASMIPAFKHRLPPVRRLWMCEDERQSLFDAAALALTHYASQEAASDP